MRLNKSELKEFLRVNLEKHGSSLEEFEQALSGGGLEKQAFDALGESWKFLQSGVGKLWAASLMLGGAGGIAANKLYQGYQDSQDQQDKKRELIQMMNESNSRLKRELDARKAKVQTTGYGY